jgi:hypothetical protein
LPNLSEDSPVKSFVAEDEAALAITVSHRERENVLFAVLKHGVLMLLREAGKLLKELTEARILSE